jgi:uncharacterized protein
MTPHGFAYYELRTTSLDGARTFYQHALGLDLHGDESRVFVGRGAECLGELTLLPERARAQGAPAHWLGHLAVDAVEVAAERVVAAGGMRLGPSRQSDGALIVGLRDPFGAPVAVTSRPAGAQLAWHELHTVDQEGAFTLYGDLCGVTAAGRLELGEDLGTYQKFAFDGSPSAVGGMLNSARRPGIHPHWLFYFEVPDLERAERAVVEHGGRALEAPRSFEGRARRVALTLGSGHQNPWCQTPRP